MTKKILFLFAITSIVSFASYADDNKFEEGNAALNENKTFACDKCRRTEDMEELLAGCGCGKKKKTEEEEKTFV